MTASEDPILDDDAHWLTSANRWGELFATWQRGVEAHAAVCPADLDEARIEAYNAAHVVACGEAPDEQLSPYWSWVIALYGETVRAALGRDTALDAAVVPLHLVAECQGLSAVLGDEAEHGGQAQSRYRSDAHRHHSDGLFDSLTRVSSGQTVFAAESNPVRSSSSDDDIPF